MLIQTRVVFSPTLKCFVDVASTTKYRGITQLLKQVFWPDYSFKKAQAPGPVGVGNSKFVKGPTSSKRGTLVDLQISELIAGKPITGKLHPFTALAFKALKAGNLQPVASQVVVYDAALRLATAVDILCENKDGKHVVVELKCSSDFKYTAYNACMKHEFQQISNSIANQHLAQTLVTRALFERTYGTAALAYILKVNQRGASWIRVPDATESLEGVLSRMSTRGSTRVRAKAPARPRLARSTRV
jgi:hypothetical protein